MSTKIKIGVISFFAVAIAGTAAYRALSEPTAPPDASGRPPSPDSSQPAPVEVTMLYGSEKKDWIEESAASFRREHPEIRLTLSPRGSIDAAEAVLAERERPTVFSPADSLVLNMLASDWRAKGRPALYAESGPDAPKSLVMTPLVFVAWEDRATALLKRGGGEIRWRTLHDAAVAPRGWAEAGGRAEWGFVKLGHADPTKSNSGLGALVLMSLEYTGKQTLEVRDLLDPQYQTFVRQTERAVASFEPSTSTFMTEMVRFGPSKYDVALVYENLAIGSIESAEQRWGRLNVYYPHATIWSDHPAVILDADWVTTEQRAAARLWLDHLHSRGRQQRALAHGFRPGDTSVPVRTADQDNPFNRLASRGVRVNVPGAARVPDNAAIKNLVTMWSRTSAPVAVR